MIHNLYIITEAGVAVYSKNFAKSTMDEQLISGFILAIGNFATEAVGSGLKKIEMQTGEQLFVYYDSTLKLTAAAITGAQDYLKLITKILQKVLIKFNSTIDQQLIQLGQLGKTSEFDSELNKLMGKNTAKRDKKRFILGLTLGTLLLTGLYLLFWTGFLDTISQFIVAMETLPPTTPEKYIAMIFASGDFSLGLELLLIICFTPSALIGGYIVGSRNKGKLLGLIFYFLSMGVSLFTVLLMIKTDEMMIIPFLFLYMMIIYIPLVLVTSIIFSYLGGWLRDRRKMYPIPPEKQLEVVTGK